MAQTNSKPKKKRFNVGSVRKNKDGKGVYIQLQAGKWSQPLIEALKTGDEKKGITLIVESKEQQLASAEAAFQSKKISEEVYNKVMDRLEKIPEYVNFEIILLQDVVDQA